MEAIFQDAGPGLTIAFGGLEDLLYPLSSTVSSFSRANAGAGKLCTSPEGETPHSPLLPHYADSFWDRLGTGVSSPEGF